MATSPSKKIVQLAEKAKFGERGEALQRKVWPELEKFLIAGPTLIGFALGLLNYVPAQKHFEVAFQSLCFFVAYLVALIVAQTLDTLILNSWPVVLGAIRSLLAAAYLALTMKQYFEWRKDSVKTYAWVAKLRARFAQAIGNAA